MSERYMLEILIRDLKYLIKNNWRAKLVGMLSIAGIWYFSSWQLTVFIVGYHVAHVLGRHKNKGEE